MLVLLVLDLSRRKHLDTPHVVVIVLGNVSDWRYCVLADVSMRLVQYGACVVLLLWSLNYGSVFCTSCSINTFKVRTRW